MYRVSFATYLVGGVVAAAIAKSDVMCAATEILIMSPPAGMSCREFLQPYIKAAGGVLLKSTVTASCRYCSVVDTDEFLARFNISYNDRWRNFHLL